MLRKGTQNGMEPPKNLWFDNSQDLFSLISCLNLQRSQPLGSSEVKKGLRILLKHQKIYDLIPNIKHDPCAISTHDLCGSKKLEKMSD